MSGWGNKADAKLAPLQSHVGPGNTGNTNSIFGITATEEANTFNPATVHAGWVYIERGQGYIKNITIANAGSGINANGFLTVVGSNTSPANISYGVSTVTNNIASIVINNAGSGVNANGYMALSGVGDGSANIKFIASSNANGQLNVVSSFVINNGGQGLTGNVFVNITGGFANANVTLVPGITGATNAAYNVVTTVAVLAPGASYVAQADYRQGTAAAVYPIKGIANATFNVVWGGRYGRNVTEVLVAMGSMTANLVSNSENVVITGRYV